MPSMRQTWEMDGLTKADLDPIQIGYWDSHQEMAQGSVWRFLSRLLARGAQPGIQAMEYKQPRGRLYHRVKVPGCTDQFVDLPSAAGEIGFRPGQMVTVASTRLGGVVLGTPPSGVVGVSAYAVDDLDAGSMNAFRITAVTPNTETWAYGRSRSDELLTISGYGFLEDPVDDFFAAVYDGDETSPTFDTYQPDPYVTLHDPVWISSTEATVLADFLATTPHGYRVGIAMRRS